MAEENRDTQTTETTETTETFIEEVEVKRTRKSPASAASQSAGNKKAEAYKVIVPLLNVREKASLVSEILGVLQEGDIIDIVARTPQGFGKLSDDEGYVKLEFLQKVTNG